MLPDRRNMKLAFITDEATQDLHEAIRFAKDYHLDGVELRSVYDTPIDQIPADTLTDWKRQLDENGLRVCSLASSFYKCGTSPEEISENMEKLNRLCSASDILDCPVIRGFAFFSPESGLIPAAELVPFFDEPIRLLKARKKTLLLEADPSVNTTSHRALASLLKAIDSPCAGAIFDPGNDIYDPFREQPFPEGYMAIRPWIRHIHIKDAIYKNGEPECVMIGTGLVPYPELLAQIAADGYQGWLSLETHYRKDIVLTEEQMRLPQGASFSVGGLAAAAESAEALHTLLNEVQKGREASL